MKKRYSFIDVARILALFAIIYYHSLRTLDGTGIRMLEQTQQFYKTKNYNIATAAVGLFFIISGAGLASSYLSRGKELRYSEYFKNRFLRLMVPYYITYIVVLAVKLVKYRSLTTIFGEGWKPLNFIFPILGIDGFLSSIGVTSNYIGVGEWFLGALLVCYILFPLLYRGMQKKKALTTVVMSAYIIILLISYQLIPFINRMPVYMNPLVKIYEFFFGMFFIMITDKVPQILKYVLGAISLLILAFYLWYPRWLSESYEGIRILIQNVSIFLILCSMEKLFDKAKALKRPVEWVCSISYEIFLVHHVILIAVITGFAGVLPYESNMGVLVSFVISYIAIFVASLALHYAVTWIMKTKSR